VDQKKINTIEHQMAAKGKLQQKYCMGKMDEKKLVELPLKGPGSGREAAYSVSLTSNWV